MDTITQVEQIKLIDEKCTEKIVDVKPEIRQEIEENNCIEVPNVRAVNSDLEQNSQVVLPKNNENELNKQIDVNIEKEQINNCKNIEKTKNSFSDEEIVKNTITIEKDTCLETNKQSDDCNRAHFSVDPDKKLFENNIVNAEDDSVENCEIEEINDILDEILLDIKGNSSSQNIDDKYSNLASDKDVFQSSENKKDGVKKNKNLINSINEEKTLLDTKTVMLKKLSDNNDSIKNVSKSIKISSILTGPHKRKATVNDLEINYKSRRLNVQKTEKNVKIDNKQQKLHSTELSPNKVRRSLKHTKENEQIKKNDLNQSDFSSENNQATREKFNLIIRSVQDINSEATMSKKTSNSAEKSTNSKMSSSILQNLTKFQQSAECDQTEINNISKSTEFNNDYSISTELQSKPDSSLNKKMIQMNIKKRVDKNTKLDKFLTENKVSIKNLRLIVNKFNKLYILCKSKKADKLRKHTIYAHKFKHCFKTQQIKYIKQKYKIKRKKSKQNKKQKNIENESTPTINDDGGSVRDKILKQLELLRSNKKQDRPLINVTKINVPVKFNLKDDICNFNVKLPKVDSPKPSTSYIENNGIVENKNLNKKNIDTIIEKYQIDIENDCNNSSQDGLIKPTKTSDITKIKGWRNKQFFNNKTIHKNDEKPDVPSKKNTDETKNVNSAFESEALDQFLTNNSKLNISYEVPKLIAEEAITQIPGIIKNVNIQNNVTSTNVQSNKTSLAKSEKRCKAKTLAEKRKMLECVRQKDLLHEIEINETSIMKQLRRDEKRQRFETIGKIRNMLKNQTIPITRDCWIAVMRADNNKSISQTIKVDNELIQIVGSCGGPTIQLDDNKNLTFSNKSPKYIQQNVVILNDVDNKEVKQTYDTMLKYNYELVNYKPGPLSKKPKLDVLKNTKWETVVVNLPKIVLEVHSECGKAMHPDIQPYLQAEISEQGFISNLWAKFAASASETKHKTEFNFPLKYANNQNKILMKKELLNNVENITPGKKYIPIEGVDIEVQDIMNDILNYLDGPVLNNSNIKYCPDCPKFEEKSLKPIEPILTDIHAVLTTSRKRKVPSANLKTERELKRLNVQVIEVDMETDNKKRKLETGPCNKEECRLGCVCFDLNADWPQHCGREFCQFHCDCKAMKLNDKQRGHQYIRLPEGADLLSASTMYQIRDQAKKNLAKEERKFTQTVIKANNQTIVVGEGCRERRTRFNKYSNKNNDNKKQNENQKENISNDTAEIPVIKRIAPSIWKGNEHQVRILEDKKETPVFVKQEIVPKLKNLVELSDVLTWCMVHNLYKCFCMGHALEDNLVEKKSKKIVNENCEKNEEEYIEYSSKRGYTTSNPFLVVESNACARIRGIPNFYLSRNKSQYFKTRNSNLIKDESTCIYVRKNKKQNRHIDIGTDEFNAENLLNMSSSNSHSEQNTVERVETEKNVDENKCDQSSTERSFRSARLSKKYNSLENYVQSLETGKRKYKKVSITEKLHEKRNELKNKLKKKEYKKSVLKPKKDEIIQVEDISEDKNSFKEKEFETDINAELVVKFVNNNSPLEISSNFMLPDLVVPLPDVQNHFRSVVFKSSTSKNIFRMMNWEKLVENFQQNNISIWYDPTGSDAKLIATKGNEQPSTKYVNAKTVQNVSSDMPDIVVGLLKNQLPGKAFDARNTYGIFLFNGRHWEIRGTILKKINDKPLVREDILEDKVFVNKLHLESKSIPLTIAEPESTVNKPRPASIRVPIPIGQKDSRWFMLTLENDFSTLRIKDSDIPIKYAQLKQASQFAMRVGRTVRFLIPRNNSSQENNPTFGGYAVPGLLDRIFFGPYNLTENHNIATFRYINGKLKDTRIVAKLTGSKRSKGIWLYTKGGNADCVDLGIESNILRNEQVIFVDLTEENETEIDINSWNTVNREEMNDQELDNNTDKQKYISTADVSIQKITNTDTLMTSEQSYQLTGSYDLQMPVLEKIDQNKLNTVEKSMEMPKLMPINKNLSIIDDIKESSKKSILKSSAGDIIDKIKLLGSKNRNKLTPSETTLTGGDQMSKEIIENNTNILQKTDNVIEIESTSQPSTSSVDCSKQVVNKKIKTRKRKIDKSIDKTASLVCDDDLEIISSTISNQAQNKTMWLISEPRNMGYIEIKTYSNGRIGLLSPINKRLLRFNELSFAIEWIDKLLRKNMYFVPIDFQIRMYLVEDSKILAGRKSLEEQELRGYHMICAKGLIDMTELNAQKLDDMGISIREREKILSKLPEFIEKKFVYSIGENFLQTETMRSMLLETIVNMAPSYVRRLQKQNVNLKREKQILMLANQNLQRRLNSLSEMLNSNPKSTLPNNSDDDDVILINDDNKQTTSSNVTSSIDQLSITNVTSLASQPTDMSTEHFSGKKLLPLSKLEIKPGSSVNINKSVTVKMKTSSETTKPVYAPVLLPDGKQLLIPINPNKGKKLVVSKSALSPVKRLVTFKPSPSTNDTIRTIPNTSLNVAATSSVTKGVPTVLKYTFPTSLLKPSNSFSIPLSKVIQSVSNLTTNSTKPSIPSTPEVIEID